MVIYDKTRQNRDTNSIWLMCIASRITMSIDTNSEYVFFSGNNNYWKALHWCALRKVPVVWHFTVSWICVLNRTTFERVLDIRNFISKDTLSSIYKIISLYALRKRVWYLLVVLHFGQGSVLYFEIHFQLIFSVKWTFLECYVFILMPPYSV